MSEQTIDATKTEESSTSTTPESIPYDRFKEKNDEVKRLRQELEQAKQATQKQESEPDFSAFGEDTLKMVDAKTSSAVKAAAQQIKEELRRENNEKAYFSGLEEGMPKPDLEQIKAYANKNGLDNVRAYKELYEDDIFDFKIKKAQRPSLSTETGHAPTNSDSVLSLDDMKQLLKEKGPEAVREYMKTTNQ